MTGAMDQMSRAIGDLEASVRSFKETWANQDREATEGRRRLHKKIDDMADQQREKIDELGAQQQEVATTVAQQTKKLAEIEPAIKRFEAQRQREEGARSLIKVGWAAIVAFATGLGYVGHFVLQYFWPPKGH